MENRMISVVTGANGFVGSHLVDFLLNKGHEVRVIVRETSNMRWLEGKDIEKFDCGLFDKEGMKKAFENANYVFHVAGVVKAKNENGYYQGNVETTRNLLKALEESSHNLKKLVVVSSQTAVGPSPEGTDIGEEHEPQPITTYGRSKLEQEKLVMSYKDKLPITICRAPAVYGQRDTEIYLIFKAFKQGIMGKIGFDRKLVSLIHVEDLVRGFYLAAISEKSTGQIYFITSNEPYDWDTVGDAIANAIGKDAIRLKIPHFLVYSVAGLAQFFALFSNKAATFNLEKARDFVQSRWTCSSQKAKHDLGFTQEISIDDGVKRTVDWYKDKKWL
jgi:nucleoside-diphosphate-sugar epimerase